MAPSVARLLLASLLLQTPFTIASTSREPWIDPLQDLTPDQAYRDAVKVLQRTSSHSPNYQATQSSGLRHHVKNTLSLLFFNSPTDDDTHYTDALPNDRLRRAKRLLTVAADANHPDAVYLLADMNFFGNYSHPRNLSQAYQRYSQLAELTGNASAQHMLGFFHATGVGDVVPQDQARALLYYTFAADQGNERSQMALAYRHHYGIGTPKSCETAVQYWQLVAERAIRYIRSGPPGGHRVARRGYRIPDEDGGIYGEGASVSSAGTNARNSPAHSDAHASHSDVLEYLDMAAKQGEVKSTFKLSKMMFEGRKNMEPDYVQARKYFTMITSQYWGRNGPKKTEAGTMLEKLAGLSAGYMGWMNLRGEGGPRNYNAARVWFKRGIELGDSQSQYGMGVIFAEGLGTAKNVKRASDYLAAAADLDNPGAQNKLGMLHLDAGDIRTALMYFELAARKGNVEAYYYLGESERMGIGQDKSCDFAAYHYKTVAERVEPVITSFIEANQALEAEDYDFALLDFMLAAEQGFEIAQTNSAYLLDKSHHRNIFSRLSLPSAVAQQIPAAPVRVLSTLKLAMPSSLALTFWTRSARQGNVDSLIKMGDYYLDGLGVHADAHKAAACYQAAAETLQSAQAYWNLGWMYENGLGGHEQDFHLAKRFYDQALETNKEAYLPVKLALVKLRMRSRWNEWTRGSARSIQKEPRKRTHNNFREWLADLLDAEEDEAERRYREEYDGLEEFMPVDYDEWSDPAARYADMTDEQLWLELMDGLIEGIVIFALAAALAVLVIYRRQRADRRAVDEQRNRLAGEANNAAAGAAAVPNAGPPQAGDHGGLFPQPGQPEFMNWAAGGIGH